MQNEEYMELKNEVPEIKKEIDKLPEEEQTKLLYLIKGINMAAELKKPA
jgi:hypothetical protein